MRFRIYGEDVNGNEDSVVVEGDTIEDVIVAARHEESSRGWSNCWSEELGD